jgi:2-oxoglutarate ferredoxin oxidoreductase subunit alpha
MIEDAETRNQQQLKRLRKSNGLKNEFMKPKFKQEPDAGLTLIGWGSTYGAIKEAADLLKKDGKAVNTLNLSEIWPFPTEFISSVLSKTGRSVVIEGNTTAQLAALIKRETGYEADNTILKFDGRPFSPEEIVGRLRKEVL